MKHRDSGFTVVELMVVVVIASVLLALAVPGFQDIVKVNRLASVTNDLTFAMMRARAEALKLGRTVVVCGSDNPNADIPTCTGNWNLGWIVFADDDEDRNYTGGEALILVRDKLSDSYTIDKVFQNGNGDGDYVAFRKQGVTAGIRGSFEIEDTTYEDSDRLVCIAATGRARVLMRTPTNGCDCENAQLCT